MISRTNSTKSVVDPPPSRMPVRRLVLLAAALGIAALAAFGLLAGCGGTSSSSSQSTGTASTGASTGDYLKVIVYGTAQAPYTSLDPDQDFSPMVLANVYEGLTKYVAKTGEILPVLATSWEKSADALTWTFHLRQGVKFHDGSEFDSAAVKSSILHSKDVGQSG